MGNPDSNLHIAMVTSPGIGHLTPALELANRLVSIKGVQVTFFTTSSSSISSTTPPGLHLINLSPVAPTGTDLLTRITIIIRNSLPSIQSSIKNSPFPPKVMIVDEFSTEAFAIAESFSMQMYMLVTMNATELAFMAYLPKLERQIRMNNNQVTDPLQIPGCKPIPIKYFNDSFQDRKSSAYSCFLQHAERIVKASAILINTYEALEPQTISSFDTDDIARQIPLPRVYPVGPLVKSSNITPIGGDYLTWLDKQPSESVVFVSFGSGGTLSSEQMIEVALGLEMSQQRFLWVVRPPSSHDKAAGSAAYYFKGDNNKNNEHPGSYLPDGFLDRTRKNGFVVSNWVQQIEILRHEAVGGFLSHCGWNSSIESIVHGVPLIAFPLFAEQRLNAWVMAEDVKAAVRSEFSPREGVVGREEIERMVRLVMEKEEGKNLRKKARELSESAVRALEEGGSSYASLSHFVERCKSIQE